MEDQSEEKTTYNWIIVFNEPGKAYAYAYRTISYMTLAVQSFHKKSGKYPYRMWAIVDGEMVKVDIT